jgi:hypothetical protein
MPVAAQPSSQSRYIPFIGAWRGKSIRLPGKNAICAGRFYANSLTAGLRSPPKTRAKGRFEGADGQNFL